MADQIPLLPYNRYMTEPLHLPIRQEDDKGGPEFLVQAEVKEPSASRRRMVLQFSAPVVCRSTAFCWFPICRACTRLGHCHRLDMKLVAQMMCECRNFRT